MAVLYPFDPTGMAADNLVFEEPHAVTEAHYRDYHFIIPDFAPFYGEGLVITLAGSDPVQVLTAGVDYFEVLPYEAATRSIGKPIYGAIALNSRWTSGVLLFTYQTLGGQWVADRSHVYKALAEKAYNPRTTVWDVLTNVAAAFPPINHTQNFSDYYDEGELIKAITRLGTDIAREADSLPVVRHLRDFGNPHKTTKAQVELGNVENYPMATTEQALSGDIAEAYISPKTLKDVRAAIKTEFSTSINGVQRWLSSVLEQLNRHKADEKNPHKVTKEQLDLGLVENWRMAHSDEVKVHTSADDFAPADNILINPQTLELVRLSVLDNLASAVRELNDSIKSLSDSVDTHKADESNPHKVTKEQLDLGLVENWRMATDAEALTGTETNVLINPNSLKAVRDAITDDYTTAISDASTTLSSAIDNATTALDTHKSDESNPHKVTKEQLDLGLVGNWRMATDAEVLDGTANNVLVNPHNLQVIRTATTTEITTATTNIYNYIGDTVTIINESIDTGGTAITDHIADTTNPHSVTATQVGLGQVVDLPLATDLEVANGDAVDKYVTLRQIVDYLTTRAGLMYTLTSATELVEGESLSVTLTTARVISGTQYHWSVVHGTTSSVNFISSSGVLTVVENSASFTLTATLQPELNPDRTFSLIVRESSIDGRVVALSDPIMLINVTRVPDYQFHIASTTILLDRSDTMPILLTVYNTPVGTTLYWEIDAKTALLSDFKQIAGEVIVAGQDVRWSIATYPTMTARYLSTFKLILRRGGVDGEIVAISDLLTFEGALPASQAITAKSLFEPGVRLTPDNYYKVTTFTRNDKHYKGRKLRKQTGGMATFSLAPSVTILNEGDSLRIDVTTSRDIGYQTIYWKVLHGGTSSDDFTADRGILEIIGTKGRIDLTTIFKTADVGERSFSIGLMASNYTETPFVTTTPITLLNIDTATLYRITASSWTIATKLTKQIQFNVTTSKLANGTNLIWKVKHIDTNYADFTTDVGNTTVMNDAASFTVMLSDLIKRMPMAKFRVQIYEGMSLLATSALITVYSDLQAAGLMQLESLYDPFVTATARNYYWINNVGRRNLVEQPLLPHNYALNVTSTTVPEGSAVTASLTAINISDGTVFYWTIEHGTTTASDFTTTSGVVTMVAGRAEWTLSTIYSSVNTPDKTYSIVVRAYAATSYPALVRKDNLAIGNIYYYEPTYAIATSQTTYDSMTVSSIPVTVTTTHLSDTTFTWRVVPISSGLGNSSFTLVQGSVSVYSGTGQFTIGLTTTIRSIDPAQFKVKLFSGTTEVAVTDSITVTDLTIYPTYSLAAGASSLAEGQSWPMTAHTTDLATGTTLYWSILLETALSSQFKVLTGSIVTTGDATSWNIDTHASLLKDIARTFRVQLRTGSASGSIVATSDSLTIADIVGHILDLHQVMPCCLYEATKPIDAADYYVIGVHPPIRR